MSTTPHTTNTDTTETAITMALSTLRVVSVVTLSTPRVVSVLISRHCSGCVVESAELYRQW